MKQSPLVMVLISALAACGGGGSEPASVPETSAPSPAASSAGAPVPGSRARTNETTQITTSPGSPPLRTNETTQATTSSAPFSAELTGGPAEGDTLRGITRFEIRGAGIRGAELLHVDGPDPASRPFFISANSDVAFIDFDTSTLGDGPVRLSVVAFDRPIGEADARVILVMPPRTVMLNNLGPFLPIQHTVIQFPRNPPAGFVIR